MSRYDVAVDLGGTRLRVALVRIADEGKPFGHGIPKLLARREEATALAGGPRVTVEQIARMAVEALSEEGEGWESVRRMGIASPGPLDPLQGVILSPPNLPGWHMFPLGDELQRVSGAGARILNDAEAAALAEYHFGAGNGRGTLVYLTVSTGIGGGVVIRGQLVEGSWGAGTELGHISVDRHGRPCRCGGVGCIEALASGTAIAERFQEALASGAQSSLGSSTGRTTSAIEIARAAREGDELSQRIFADAMEALGFGVVTIINVFDPDVVALGGGVTRTGEQLFGPVRAIAEKHSMRVPGRKVRVVPAELGENVGLIGAAIVAATESLPPASI